MADTRGCWSLSEAWEEKASAEWVPLPDVFLLDNDIGHFRDNVDTDGPLTRTNLGTELTAYAPGITDITRWSAGSSCQTHALFAGGGTSGATSPPSVSSTYKLTYSSYTSARAPAADLPTPKAISIGVASEDNAYINSGYEAGGSPAGQTGTCKISFATDTTTNLPSATIAGINWEMQSLTDGAGGGYLFGGTWIPGQANTGSRCYKITYSTDGLAQLPGSNTTWNSLETNRNPETSRASMMNRTAGYQSGGNSFPGSDGSSMTTKLTYSSMAWSVVPGAYLPNPRRKAASGTGNAKGWYGCGYQSGNHSNFTLLDFSAETWTAVPGMNHPGPSSSGNESANTSTSPRDSLKGSDKSSGQGNGYVGGSRERWFDEKVQGDFAVDFDGSGDYLSISDSEDFTITGDFTFECWFKADDVSGGQAIAGHWQLGGGTQRNFDFYLSGSTLYFEHCRQSTNFSVSTSISAGQWYHVAGVLDTSVDKIFLYVNGILKGSNSAFGNANNSTANFGIGGYATGTVEAFNGKISNVRFVNGTAVYTTDVDDGELAFTPPTEPLTAIPNTKLLCCNGSTTTSSTVTPGTITANGDPTVANETALQINQPPAATPTTSTFNAGIPEYGYIAGGFGNVSSISKLAMSSETYTRLDSALYETNRRLTGFGNLTQGYATGGTQPIRSNCQKFVYSTDVRTTLTSTLSAGRGYMKAIGNNTAGYVGGGTPQGSYGEKLDKMPYSNETFSSLPSLPGSRYRYGSLGNQTQGYFAGGWPAQQNKVKKITYSSDSYANAPNMSYSATFQTGTGNATKGYIVSGEGGGTKVDRVTFSNDTISRVPSADLSATRYSLEANNSPSKAYLTGGGPGVKTNTEVITFSNDTTELSTTANANTGDNQAGAFAAFGPNWLGNPGSDIQPTFI